MGKLELDERQKQAAQECRNGLQKYFYLQKQNNVIREIPLSPVEAARLKPAWIDRLQPWIIIGFLIGMIALGNYLADLSEKIILPF